jgi:cell division protein FtsB
MEENVKDTTSFSPSKWATDLFCKINRRLVIDIVVILIPIFLIYIYIVGMGTLPEVKETQKQNKLIESKVDSLKTDNQFIVERMYQMEKNQAMFFDMVNKNNELIQENNKQLSKLKKIYNDKISNVGTYDVSQLDSFFTKKYEQYYNR